MVRVDLGTALSTSRTGVHTNVADSRRRRVVPPNEGAHVFVYFSNRLGCLGTLRVSVVVTAILLAIFVF